MVNDMRVGKSRALDLEIAAQNSQLFVQCDVLFIGVVKRVAQQFTEAADHRDCLVVAFITNQVR